MTDFIDDNYEVLQQLGSESLVEYVELSEVVKFQKKLIERFGGTPGIKDAGLLESAMNRPMNLAVYEGVTDPLALGVSLSYGIIKNHAFHDGNKRTGLAALALFLQKNNVDFACDINGKLNLIREVARGNLDEAQMLYELTALLTEASVELKGPK